MTSYRIEPPAGHVVIAVTPTIIWAQLAPSIKNTIPKSPLAYAHIKDADESLRSLEWHTTQWQTDSAIKGCVAGPSTEAFDPADYGEGVVAVHTKSLFLVTAQDTLWAINVHTTNTQQQTETVYHPVYMQTGEDAVRTNIPGIGADTLQVRHARVFPRFYGIFLLFFLHGPNYLLPILSVPVLPRFAPRNCPAG